MRPKWDPVQLFTISPRVLYPTATTPDSAGIGIGIVLLWPSYVILTLTGAMERNIYGGRAPPLPLRVSSKGL